MSNPYSPALASANENVSRFRSEMLISLRSIITRNIIRSNERQARQEHLREARYNEIQAEALTVGRKNAAVEMQWNELIELSTAQSTAESLAFQTNACSDLIKLKTEKISKFKESLKEANLVFVNSLKLFEEDAESLAALIESNLSSLSTQLDKQLSDFGSACLASRSARVKSHAEEISRLFNQRSAAEEGELLDQRSKREQGYFTETDSLIRTEGASFNATRAELEKQVHTLEQHLQKNQALCLLNRERLEYNLRLLGERTREQLAIEKRYKFQLNRLRGVRGVLSDRLAKTKASLQAENTSLGKDYVRLTKTYRELLEKSRLQSAVDGEKYAELWGMHEAEVNDLVDKILQVDQILHSDVLGLPWSAPREDELGAEVDAAASEAGTVKSSAILASESSGAGGAKSRFGSDKLKAVIELISFEAEFLLGAIDTSTDTSSYSLNRVDALLRSLGVETPEDMDLLVAGFFKGQDEDDHTLMVSGDEVLRILTEFVELKEEQRIANVAPVKKKKRKGPQVESAEMRTRRRREERKFWDKRAHALPSWRTDRVWPALVERSEQFLAALQKRDRNRIQLAKISHENIQLNNLLNQYLSSSVNNDLICKPILN